jgi:hypothetical protein
MDSLAGYIATICVGAAGQYLSQFLRPKVKIHYWMSHSFTYTIPNNQLNASQNAVPALPPVLNPAAIRARPPNAPPNYFLLTQSVTIQNFGRECADWIEIVHAQRPDFFQLHPALNYTETTGPTGEHVLRVESLAAKEFFTIQFLCYTHAPALWYIRSTTAIALVRLAILIGAGFTVYWIIKVGIFVLKSMGAL